MIIKCWFFHPTTWLDHLLVLINFIVYLRILIYKIKYHLTDKRNTIGFSILFIVIIIKIIVLIRLYNVCKCGWMWVHYHGSHMEVRRQLLGADSFLLLWFLEIKLGSSGKCFHHWVFNYSLKTFFSDLDFYFLC